MKKRSILSLLVVSVFLLGSCDLCNSIFKAVEDVKMIVDNGIVIPDFVEAAVNDLTDEEKANLAVFDQMDFKREGTEVLKGKIATYSCDLTIGIDIDKFVLNGTVDVIGVVDDYKEKVTVSKIVFTDFKVTEDFDVNSIEGTVSLDDSEYTSEKIKNLWATFEKIKKDNE